MAPPKKSTSSKPKQPTKIKRVKEVLFDEDARKEYLTGFSKRKKQRELAVRVKAIDKEREEKNESRRQVSFINQPSFNTFFFPNLFTLEVTWNAGLPRCCRYSERFSQHLTEILMTPFEMENLFNFHFISPPTLSPFHLSLSLTAPRKIVLPLIPNGKKFKLTSVRHFWEQNPGQR
jgi:hypothetical protein